MSKQHSTAPATGAKPTKPTKPYPEFPLTAHPAGYRCKKIRGKVHYTTPVAGSGDYHGQPSPAHTPRPVRLCRGDNKNLLPDLKPTTAHQQESGEELTHVLFRAVCP